MCVCVYVCMCMCMFTSVQAYGGDGKEATTHKRDSSEAVAEKVACPIEQQKLSLPIVWVVHSGRGHGDNQLLEELNLEVQEVDTWYNYGSANTNERPEDLR